MQRSKLRGIPLRGIARELCISRNAVRRYAYALSPPANRSRHRPEEPGVETYRGGRQLIFSLDT